MRVKKFIISSGNPIYSIVVIQITMRCIFGGSVGQDEMEAGFSLVELLVVIVIIGILSGIAIAAFMNQRKKANDVAVQHDIRNVVIKIEAMRTDMPNPKFILSETEEEFSGVAVITLQADDEESEKKVSETVSLSDGVIVSVSQKSETDNDNYVILGGHENGDKYVLDSTGNFQNGKTLIYDSSAGGFQPAGTSNP